MDIEVVPEICINPGAMVDEVPPNNFNPNPWGRLFIITLVTVSVQFIGKSIILLPLHIDCSSEPPDIVSSGLSPTAIL